MIPKSDAITEIMRINRGASAEFLAEFSNEQLVEYLGRLHGLPGTDTCLPASRRPSSAREVTVMPPVRLV